MANQTPDPSNTGLRAFPDRARRPMSGGNATFSGKQREELRRMVNDAVDDRLKDLLGNYNLTPKADPIQHGVSNNFVPPAPAAPPTPPAQTAPAALQQAPPQTLDLSEEDEVMTHSGGKVTTPAPRANPAPSVSPQPGGPAPAALQVVSESGPARVGDNIVLLSEHQITPAMVSLINEATSPERQQALLAIAITDQPAQVRLGKMRKTP